MATDDVNRAEPAGARTAPSLTISRGLDVLRCFRDGADDLGVSDIARMLDLSKSAVHRFLASLVEAGFVERDPDTSRYRIGTALTEYGQLAYRRHRMHLVEPILARAVAAGPLYGAIAVRDGLDSVSICFSSQAELPGRGVLGARTPLSFSAMGRVLLSTSSQIDRDLDALRDDYGPAGLRERSIDDLRALLATIAERGYDINDQESARGWRAIAVAIPAARGDVRYSLAFGGDLRTMSRRSLPRLVEHAHTTAAAIADAFAADRVAAPTEIPF